MKDTIYTIPISEVFEPKRGCPLCALFSTLETRWVDYITGAAMMEPDVRVETNKKGFCSHHFQEMLGQRNRLSVALMLQTRLDWLNGNLEAQVPRAAGGLFGGRASSAPEGGSCFVCEKIDGEFTRILDNLVTLWGRDQEFRALYGEQEYLCFPHFRRLGAMGAARLKGKDSAEFGRVTTALSRKRLEALKRDIDAFCQLFDYRSAGGGRPEEAVASSIERSIAFLTGEPGEPV